MTTAQEKALAQLEEAFAAVHAAGLSVMGMDTQLYAIDSGQLKAAEQRGQTRYDAFGSEDVVTIRAAAYIDSGGW